MPYIRIYLSKQESIVILKTIMHSNTFKGYSIESTTHVKVKIIKFDFPKLNNYQHVSHVIKLLLKGEHFYCCEEVLLLFYYITPDIKSILHRDF